MAGTRSHTHLIEIATSPEELWRALTDPAMLTSWYCKSARFEPRVGGETMIAFGPGAETVGRVEQFEPPTHLRLSVPGTLLAEEYWLEALAGGHTRLRLVCSGMSTDPAFDAEFDATDLGWDAFLRTLKFYLEHHAGDRGEPHWQFMRIASCEEAWKGLVAPGGLALEGLATLTAGGAYSFKTPEGFACSGRIVAIEPPHNLQFTLNEANDAFLQLGFHVIGGKPSGGFDFTAWGLTPAEFQHATAQWDALLARLYPKHAKGAAA